MQLLNDSQEKRLHFNHRFMRISIKNEKNLSYIRVSASKSCTLFRIDFFKPIANRQHILCKL